jgi:hypothetical protein
MISVIGLIASLRATDPYIETIYTRGSCYKFYLFLKGIWPEANSLLQIGECEVCEEPIVV